MARRGRENGSSDDGTKGKRRVGVCACVERWARGKVIEEGRYKSGNGGEMKKARHGWGECQGAGLGKAGRLF